MVVDQNAEPPVGSIDKALALLELLAEAGPDGMALRDVVETSGLNKASAHRTLQALQHRGFADQHHALLRKLPGPLDGKRKHVTAAFDRHAPENRMRLLLGSLGQFVIAERAEALDILWACDPHHTAASARQGHEHAGAMRGMKFGRYVLVRTRVADIEGEGGLIEVAPADGNAGRLAAQGMSAIGANDKARG